MHYRCGGRRRRRRRFGFHVVFAWPAACLSWGTFNYYGALISAMYRRAGGSCQGRNIIMGDKKYQPKVDIFCVPF